MKVTISRKAHFNAAHRLQQNKQSNFFHEIVSILDQN
jgi:6-pyruvoyl-tetrahydropterin synthase